MMRNGRIIHLVGGKARPVRASFFRRVAITGIMLVATTAARAEMATIEGRADTSGHNYEWVVTNDSASPIVSIEFPHYHADLFSVPPGWQSKTTFLVNVGVPDEPGVCIATAQPPNPGIVRGGSARFGMRITAKGAPVGKGAVKVRFADGREVLVTGVELPEPPASSFKFLPVVVGAIILVLWVVIRTLRERRRRASEPPAGGVAGDGL
jgi:hypothetical protein